MNDYLSVIVDQFRPLVCVRAFYATFCVCLAQEKDSEKKKKNNWWMILDLPNSNSSSSTAEYCLPSSYQGRYDSKQPFTSVIITQKQTRPKSIGSAAGGE